ncbi:MAG: hypothetical protein JSW28_05760 [Thermoplasmata archaeon]|nr:MAG: hypothetical protein JSW28_05760 [Thermoplasmata archaeon]
MKPNYLYTKTHTLLAGWVGGETILKDTEYVVIMGVIKGPGNKTQSIGGEKEIVGPLYEARFDLPDNVDIREEAVIQCRTKHNEIKNKKFFLNFHVLDELLMPHPENKNEWLLEIGIVPKGWLTPGENILYIGYTDERFDDFMVDNIVLWYKTKPVEKGRIRGKDVDSLHHLSVIQEIDVKRDEPRD